MKIKIIKITNQLAVIEETTPILDRHQQFRKNMTPSQRNSEKLRCQNFNSTRNKEIKRQQQFLSRRNMDAELALIENERLDQLNKNKTTTNNKKITEYQAMIERKKNT